MGALAPRFARKDLDFLQGSLAIEYNRRSLNHGYLETLWRRRGCLLFGIVIRHDVNDTASGLRFKWFVRMGLGAKIQFLGIAPALKMRLRWKLESL